MRTTLAIAAGLAVLVAWSAWHRWVFLDASPYPLGIDGYYYAVQLRALLEDGALHYPSAPLGLWLLAPFAAATDPITGAKLGGALLGALVAVPAYGVGARLGGGRPAGLLAAALATTSAGSFYLSIEFLKNGIGLSIALAYVWLLLRALDAPSRRRIAAAAAALLCTIATHKMAAGLALVVTAPAIAIALRGRRALLVLAGLAALVVALALAFPGRVLGGAELDAARAALTADADWRVPALARGGRALWFGHEAAIAGVLGLVAIALALLPATRAHGTGATRAVTLAIAAVAVVTALPWLDVGDPQGLGFRLRVAAFVPMALLAAAVAGAALARAPKDVRVWGVVAFAAVWAFAQPTARDEGVVRTHPAMATAVHALEGQVPPGAVVICPERHILFMAAWYARADVRLRPERVPPARRVRLVPLAFIGAGSPLDDALRRARDVPGLAPPVGLHPRHPNGLVLVPEETWAWAVGQVPEPARSAFRRWRTI